MNLTKDPDAVIDYVVDWEDWLNGDTIFTSVWTLDSGLTEDSESETTTTTTIFVSGGTAGQQYVATNRILTAAGRTNDFSIIINVVETSVFASLQVTYNTEAEIETYMTGKLNSESWDHADPVDRGKARVTAYRLIEQLNFLGVKTDEAQANQFPRDDDSTAPQDIMDAEAELTFALLDGRDIDFDFENLFATNIKYSGVATTFDRSTKPEHILAGIPSLQAWRLLRPYLRENFSVRMERV